MGYWRLVLRRAVRETARDTKLNTGAGAMMVLVGTVLASGILWVLLGYALPDGSVSTRASKYSLCFRTGGNVPSRGFQDGQHGHGAAEELESAAIGGHVLMLAGARAEEVAQFIVSPAEPGG